VWRRRTPSGRERATDFRDSIGGRFAPARAIRTSLSLLLATLVVLASALGGVARADKRDVPDYDSRGNPEADVDSWVLWIPRVALFPLYAANEYVLRRPLGMAFAHAERDRWSDAVAELFHFGKGGHSVAYPVAAFDLGLLPSVGVHYAHDDWFAAGNTLAIHATTWGPRWIDLATADRYALDKADSIAVRAELERGKDDLFFGLGPDVTSATRSRYGLERLEAELVFHRRLAEIAWLDAESGVRHTTFLDDACCDDPSLDERIARGELMAPPGYRERTTAGFARLDVALDTRRPRPEPGSGGFLRLHGRPSVDVHGRGAWLGYGGVAGGAIDLTGHRRTLTAQLVLDFTDPLSGALPFTEYPVLGGDAMPGFVTGWLTGRSTAAAQLGYTWPIWLGLDARARFSAGNAFGDHLSGLAPRKLRMSGDIGLTTATGRDPGFDLLLGVGTETFEQGSHITSVRIAIGSRRDM
jgi:hypothetical protein